MVMKGLLTYGCMLFWMALTSGQTVHTAYDFSGNAVKTREAHGFDGETRVLLTENAYDARGRLLSSVATLDGGAPVRTEHGYDKAGRLVTVARGSLADSLSYNVRGWLTGKRSGTFTMALYYADSLVARVEPSWNGNISAWEWGHGADADRMLSFSYDGADRLTGSTAFERVGAGWTESSTGNAERDITYDGNGNLLTLARTAGGVVVDDLEYGYEGNRLVSVEDKAQPGRKGDVFRVGNSSYAYDANGNMVEDTGRELTFGYNVLDLLETAVAGEGDTLAVYGWSADGARLWTRDGSGDGLDYLGSLTLSTEDGETRLETAAIGGGVIRVGKDGRQTAEYHVTDHLGSVRVVVDGAGDALERNDYYPFGARYGEEGWPESGNRFKFNGKEEQVTGNLGFLDYGARMYDPAVGRWWSVDPAAGDYTGHTPYGYCQGNPVNLVDPNGSWVDWWFVKPDGSIEYYQNDGADILYAVNHDWEFSDLNLRNTTASMLVNDRDILDQLMGKWRTKNSYGVYDLSYALAGRESRGEMLRTFLFLADHTEVEWGLGLFNYGGGMLYALSTLHNSDRTASLEDMGEHLGVRFETSTMMESMVHSHPGIGRSETEELSSMGWENGRILEQYDVYIKQRGTYKYSQYYVYFPNSKNMWEIPQRGKPFVRKMDMKLFLRPKALKDTLLKKRGL